MTPHRWQIIEAIYLEARKRGPGERDAFLRHASGGNVELETEVRSLLMCDSTAADALRQVVAVATCSALQSGDPEAGLRIGPYELVREIGRGGMGVVYLAVRSDAEYLQNVAVKLVRRGMDSELILSRFRRERQILADLTHPNIATILDGGSAEDGRPYIVMEYIEGQPIAQYCEQNHLPMQKRLSLFQDVCAAVHHAHQKLVIHRDIKPGNVLVNSQGVPKLLDFGVAKLLAAESLPDDSPHTAIGHRLITPDYASPEQIRGEPLSTATDVYSLGVLLYEILTGERPFRVSHASPAEMERIVCFEDPARPSEVRGIPREWRKHLAGDLDNIILKAMHKEPARRYGSAGQLSEDLDRFLRGVPVSARKDTLRYRASKLVRRNKAVSLISAALALSLVAGLVATNWQARRADRRFRELRTFANAVIFDLNDKILNVPGSTAIRAELVKTALSYLDSLARDSGGDSQILGELSRAYERIGDLQGSPYTANLGRGKEALESYRKAVSIGQALARQNPADDRSRRALIELRLRMALHHNNLGDTASALEQCLQALDSARYHGGGPVQDEDRRLMARSRSCMGDMYRAGRDPVNSMQNYQAAVALYETLPKDSEQIQTLLESALLRLGNSYMESGQLWAAVENFRRSAALREALANKHPEDLRHRRNVFVVNISLGNLLGGPRSISLGDVEGAKRHYERALAIAQDLARLDKNNAQARSDLGFAYAKMGEIRQEPEPREAAEWFRKSLAITEELWEASPENKEVGRSLANRREGLAAALSGMGRQHEALAQFTKANDILKHLVQADPRRIQYRQDLMWSYCQLAEASRNIKRFEDAAGYQQLAMPLIRQLESNRESLYVLRDVANCYETFGRLALQMSRTAEARDALGKSLNLWDAWRSRRIPGPHGPGRYDQVLRALGN